MLEKCVSNHRHQRVTMKGVPRPFLEVDETEFLLKLLVSLAVCIDLKNHLGHRHVALPGNLFDADAKAVLGTAEEDCPNRWDELFNALPFWPVTSTCTML